MSAYLESATRTAATKGQSVGEIFLSASTSAPSASTVKLRRPQLVVGSEPYAKLEELLESERLVR